MKWIWFIGGLLLATAALAVEPDEILSDPALESRARDISKQLRCVVCQNQDIDSSNAGVARDLRLIVRERLIAGDSDQKVIAYVRARYGDYVLMKPPFNPGTYVLWFTPPLLGLIAIGVGFSVVGRRRSIGKQPDLTSAEEAELSKILDEHSDGSAQ